MRLKRVLWSAANLLGGVVLVLLVLDPTRPLLSVFILLGVAEVLMIHSTFLPRSGPKP
jgi:hypothetical protein